VKRSSRRAYKGKVINVDIDTVEFPNGSVGELEMVRHPGASAVVPAALVRYGLPEDFYDTYREHMRAVTPADVQRVAREHLDPRALQLLAVGDPDSIRQPLEDLRFGPVTLYDVTGRIMSLARS
jgi:hypothetical protein